METFLKLLFQNIDPGTHYYVRLCTDASVVDADNIGSESAYGGYVPGGLAVERSVNGFTVAGSVAKNAAILTYTQCASGSEKIRYAELWKNDTDSVLADRLDWCQLANDIDVAVGGIPSIDIDQLTFTLNKT